MKNLKKQFKYFLFTVCMTAAFAISAQAACTHANATWQKSYNTVGGVGTDENTCVKYCKDCGQIVATKSHNWDYEQAEKSDSRQKTNHILYCKDCDYGYYEEHTFSYTSYEKPDVPKNPITDTVKNTSAATDHKAHAVCTKCGYETTELQKHTFNGSQCSKCGLDKGIRKVSGLKATQKGEGVHKVTNYNGKWIWDGQSWRYMKPGKADTYAYKATVSWSKSKDTYGYYCSLGSPRLKTGDYVTKTDVSIGGWHKFTRKNSATMTISAAKKVGKMEVYVAPISKYGFVGTWKKVTVRLK